MPNEQKERKHIRIKIDAEQGAQFFWIGRANGEDQYKVVVFFETLLFGEYEMATSAKAMSRKHAEIYAKRTEKNGEIDLFYWRCHY